VDDNDAVRPRIGEQWVHKVIKLSRRRRPCARTRGIVRDEID
jgi:hypothetical protein